MSAHDLSKIVVESFLAILLTILGIVIPVVWAWLAKKQRSQAEMFHREAHNLNLFRALSDRNQTLQLAAAAVLVERLKFKPASAFEASERSAIIRALISVTKDAPSSPADAGASPELTKFIADNVARQLDAVRSGRQVLGATSPLGDYDWQGARLDRAWWPSIDARRVDFFGARLSRAGLREGFFEHAVLMNADLSHSVLRDADIRAANFTNANLVGADLRGAKFENAIFKGAIYDHATMLPDGLDPGMAGMRLAPSIEGAPV